MYLVNLLTDYGLLWLMCTGAAALAMVRHYTADGVTTQLAVFANLVVVALFFGGWLIPEYVHVWEPAKFVLGPHWFIPIALWIYAAFNAPVDSVGK